MLSVVHGCLGEEDEAITILERLFEERLPALVYLNGRTYAPLRALRASKISRLALDYRSR